ncbi:dihydroneopterin aldolase [Sulfurivirga caldicuralii]|uniref:7,8-dihydroneopterin aldolase n=1 Tax=Sulfurivirga caldicuralii TaxID=364032 RepID=A0A1N6GS09_9GAMM|nr:dihydroneopterin aldolase [Sulfurivirga caldicuralii]SIO10316.1 dihydroneopterin aldolase [Sulfurivirga caldicuralii]
MQAQTPMDRIFIEQLEVKCIIGILPWEKQVPQPLRFDIELLLPLRAAGEENDLSKTVDYAEVAQRIESLLSTPHELIETVAEKVCHALLSTYPAVQQVHLRVHKPAAVQAARSVGVEIWRGR